MSSNATKYDRTHYDHKTCGGSQPTKALARMLRGVTAVCCRRHDPSFPCPCRCSSEVETNRGLGLDQGWAGKYPRTHTDNDAIVTLSEVLNAHELACKNQSLLATKIRKSDVLTSRLPASSSIFLVCSFIISEVFLVNSRSCWVEMCKVNLSVRD